MHDNRISYCFDSQTPLTQTDVKEAVNHPSHYNSGEIEVIDVIQDWKLNFCLGNAIKYIARCEHKNNKIEDIKKAIKYLEFELNDKNR